MRLIAAFLTAMLLSAGAVAQIPQPAPAATPVPQQQMMGYFVGDWTLKGTSKLSPTSPATPFTGKEHSAWVEGQFFVETHSEIRSALGDVMGTRVLEYNPQDQAYTYNAYNSVGEHIEGVGHVKGNTWTWTAVQKLNGVATKARYTLNFVSADSYSFKSEVATPNGGWAAVMEGTATRVPPPPAQ